MTSSFRYDDACALAISGRDCWFVSPYNSACNAPTASASGLTRPRNYACQPLAGGPVSNSGRQRLEAERLNDSRASIDLQQQNIYLYIELAH
jgi:hypothetical protein